MSLSQQIGWLFILSIPVACMAWTVTHEEIFREPREFCLKCSQDTTSIFKKKFFYLFTCEYCFSHYVTIAMIFFSDFKMLFPDWRGYIIAGFSVIWIANIYMSIFFRIRINIKKEKIEISVKEEQLNNK